MKRWLILCLTVLWTMICAQASGAIITGEWQRDMTGELNLDPLAFVYAYPSGNGSVAIYLGPGEQYALLAENVSSFDIDDVAGMVGSWALVNSDYGIGYVNTSSLTDKPEAEQIDFAYVTTTAPNDCCLLKSAASGHQGGYLTIVREGKEIILLAEYDGFIYAEVNMDGIPVRGFLSSEDYSLQSWKSELEKTGFFTGYDVDLRSLYADQYANKKKDSVAVGYGYAVGVRSNGTVAVHELKKWEDLPEYDLSGWSDIGLPSGAEVFGDIDFRYF